MHDFSVTITPKLHGVIRMHLLSNLQKSVLALQGLKFQLEPALRTCKRYMRDLECAGVIAGRIHILVCSFDDEWQAFTGECRKANILRPLEAAAPAVSRIRQWSGLHRVRSSFLAHTRDKQKQLVNIGELYGPGVSPTNNGEMLFLGECAVYACSTATIFFREEHTAALEELEKHWDDVDPAECGIRTFQELEREVALMRGEILQIEPGLGPVFDGEAESLTWR